MTTVAARLGRHVPAIGIFAALALTWSFPLVRHLTTHLPGPGIGDNVDFLWNFWWVRWARLHDLPLFRTAFLFAPVGTDLTLHTHTMLPAFVGATLLRPLDVIAAQNSAILAGLYLNGLCAYGLCWRTTRDTAAAVLGGIVFAGSPFISAHLYGHFNFIMAWPIPLCALAVVATAERWSTRWAVVAGLILGITAYVDYYFVVFEIVFALCYAASTLWHWSVEWRGPTRRWRLASKLIAVLLLIDAAVVVAIIKSGGLETVVAGVRILARDPLNPLQMGWALAAVWWLLRTRPALVIRRLPGTERALVLRAAMWAILASCVAAGPIVWQAVGLVRRGGYVAPPYFWKSAPRGIDLATLMLGNPLNGAWGVWIAGLYRDLGIDIVESTGWLGVVPMVLAIWSIRRVRTHQPDSGGEANDRQWLHLSILTRRWTAVLWLFLLWSLGSHLCVFGINTGMPLPQVFLHYVPIVANARMPGRAIVVVYLALAVLAAVAVSQRHRWRRPQLLLGLAFVLLVVDFVPAPFPLVQLERPSIYSVLKNRPEQGAVCELPLGIRDGSGERGTFDDRILFYQTIHERRLVGGFLARLPPSLLKAYQDDPLLGALLQLSARVPVARQTAGLPDRSRAAAQLRADDISFIVLNRQLASAGLVDYVEHVLPVRLLAEGDGRSLYLVVD